jgi:hypothetical protein
MVNYNIDEFKEWLDNQPTEKKVKYPSNLNAFLNFHQGRLGN